MTGRILTAAAALAAALFLPAAGALAQGACTKTWDGGAGSSAFAGAANWSPDGVPAASDVACVPVGATVVHGSGDHVLAGLHADGTFRLTGGNLALEGPSSAADWTQAGGTLQGAGTLTLTGTPTWSGGAARGSGMTQVNGGTTLALTGTSSLGATRTLAVDGTLAVGPGATLFRPFSADAPRLLVAGVVTHVGEGTSALDVPVSVAPTGSVRAPAGRLTLGDGSPAATPSSGRYGAAADAGKVVLDGGTHRLADGAHFAGGAEIDGATVVVTGTTAAMTGENAMRSGAVEGDGVWQLGGTFVWDGGVMRGTGTTRNPAGGRVALRGTTQLSQQRQLLNLGRIDVEDELTLFRPFSADTPLLQNLGEVVRTGPGIATFSVPVENGGVLRAATGVLRLADGSGGRASTGVFGATGSAGEVVLTGGRHVLGDGAAWAGGVALDGATLDVTGITAPSAGANAMRSGLVEGAGRWVLGGTFTWSGGTMRGDGTTAVPEDGLVRLTETASIGGRRLFLNAGTFELPAVASLFVPFSSDTPLLRNTGLLRRTGTGTVALSVPLDNDGVVRADAGTLTLSGGSGPLQESTGTFGTPTGTGELVWTSRTTVLGGGAAIAGRTAIDGGAVSAAGTVAVSGANRFTAGELDGSGTWDVVGGSLTWSGGVMRGAGTTRIGAGAALVLTENASLGEQRRLEVAGLLDVAGELSLFRQFSTATPLLRVTGTAVRTTAGAASLDVPVDNDGVVRAAAGELRLGGGSAGETWSGALGAAGAGGDAVLDGGTVQLGDGATLAARSVIGAGRADVVGLVRVTGAARLDGGTIAGDGELRVEDVLTWDGGTMGGAGTTRVPAGGRIAMSASGSLGGTRRLEVAGAFELGDVDLFRQFSVDRPSIRVTGSLTKSAGAGAASVSVPFDNDGTVRAAAGALHLTQGAAAGDASGGSFGATAPTASLVLRSGTFALAGGARFVGGVVLDGATVDAAAALPLSGVNHLRSGTLRGPGTPEVTGTLVWSGGTVAGAGTMRVAAGGLLRVPPGFARLSDGRALTAIGDVEIAGAGTLFTDATSSARFAGALRRAGGLAADVARVSGRLVADGSVLASGGVLALDPSTDAVHEADLRGGTDGGAVRLEGPYAVGPGGSLAGLVHIASSGDLQVPAGRTLAVPDELHQDGRVSGGGTLEVAGTLRWTGGRQAAPGRTEVLAGGRMTVDARCQVVAEAGRTMENLGLLRVGTGGLRIDGGFGTLASARLDSPGRIEIVLPATQDCGAGGLAGGGVLRSTGTIAKSGAGAGELDVVLDNDGALTASGGDLTVGSFAADDLEDAGPSSTGSFTSAGDTQIVVSAGRLGLGRGATLAGRFAVEGGELAIDRDARIAVPAGSRLRAAGRLTGAGTLHVLGDLSLDGALLDGPGTIEVAPTGTFAATGEASEVGGDRVLALRGPGTIADGVELWVASGGSVVNGGVLELQGTGGVDSFGDGLFHNLGTVRKTGAGNAQFGTHLDNDGLVEVTGGGLATTSVAGWSLTRRTLAGGRWAVRGGGALVLPGAPDVLAAALRIDGAGSRVLRDPDGPGGAAPVDALGGLDEVAGAGRLEVAGGATLATGRLVARGAVRVGDGSVLRATGGFVQASGSTILEGGTALLEAPGAAVGLTGGRLGGAGTLRPAVQHAGGNLDPGGDVAPGVLSGATLAQDGTSTTTMDITASGAHDQVVVAGAATLGGTLRVRTAPGAPLAAGQELVLLRAASVGGTWTLDAVPPPGLRYTLRPEATRLVLAVAAASSRPDAADPAPTPPASSAPAPAPAPEPEPEPESATRAQSTEHEVARDLGRAAADLQRARAQLRAALAAARR